MQRYKAIKFALKSVSVIETNFIKRDDVFNRKSLRENIFSTKLCVDCDSHVLHEIVQKFKQRIFIRN